MPLKEYIGAAVFKHKMAASLLSVLALAALLLAALGIYGVMSNTVKQRTNEIGIRMALGATSANILKLIVFQGIRIALAGVIVGVIASLALSRIVATLLFGVSAVDLTTFVGVSAAIIAVSILTSGFPAYRAVRMNPIKVLRVS
jgi:ABC-type antimicrobial peptide transport system permease subunit